MFEADRGSSAPVWSPRALDSAQVVKPAGGLALVEVEFPHLRPCAWPRAERPGLALSQRVSRRTPEASAARARSRDERCLTSRLGDVTRLSGQNQRTGPECITGFF